VVALSLLLQIALPTKEAPKYTILFISNRGLVFGQELPTAKVLSLALLILFLLFLLHMSNLDIVIGVSKPNTGPWWTENILKLYVWLPLSREEATSSQ